MTKALRHRIALCLASIGLSVNSVLSASDAVVPRSEPLVVTRPVSEQDRLPREFPDDPTITDTETAIADITRSEGRFSYTLIDPLTHQYEAALKAGDLAVAREMLLAIQHIMHPSMACLLYVKDQCSTNSQTFSCVQDKPKRRITRTASLRYCDEAVRERLVVHRTGTTFVD